MTIAPDRTIMALDEIVAELPHEQRSLFERIFAVTCHYGALVPPPEMLPWIARQFGSVEPTLNQKIVRVTNLITLEGVLFNWLRSSRPFWKADVSNLEEELAKDRNDPLKDPNTGTPADVFGRVRGRFCVTASNIAKFDAFHGLIVFDEANPLHWDREHLRDYLETGERWALEAHRIEPEARYYLLIWNCLWRAGSSLLHGHAQVMLGRDFHYPGVESLRRDGLRYQADFRTNYFDDLYRVHEMVGCAFERNGIRILANLAPKKEHEVLLMAPFPSDSLKDAIYDVLAALRDEIGVQSFNLAIYRPPFGSTDENWEGFPVIVRIVDRGDLASRTADFGAMELYAASVVSSDPFRLAATLAGVLN
ncbi:MAG TPA: hypothetical protein VK821_11160 [Dehalococcoidia bacterium]|nr:hypothetical protein [Dehalococcoidia bacterium]